MMMIAIVMKPRGVSGIGDLGKGRPGASEDQRFGSIICTQRNPIPLN